MTRSSLAADFSHAPAGFLFNSLIEIELTAGNYLAPGIHASAALALAQMETDFGFRGLWGQLKQRAQLLKMSRNARSCRRTNLHRRDNKRRWQINLVRGLKAGFASIFPGGRARSRQGRLWFRPRGSTNRRRSP